MGFSIWISAIMLLPIPVKDLIYKLAKERFKVAVNKLMQDQLVCSGKKEIKVLQITTDISLTAEHLATSKAESKGLI